MAKRKYIPWIGLALCALVLPIVAQSQWSGEGSHSEKKNTFIYSPYIDVVGRPLYKFDENVEASGTKHYTLAFIVAPDRSTCKPSWGGYKGYGIGTYLSDRIEALRAKGGDVTISFGGGRGEYLAGSCGDGSQASHVVALKNAYKKVVDGYQLTRIDFDIEGSWLYGHHALWTIPLRSKALAMLQAELGHEKLAIWYSLPVVPSGLTRAGLKAVRLAKEAGMNLTGVNLLAMDFGESNAPHPATKMGDYVNRCAASVFKQLKLIFPEKEDNAIWGMIGLTPMIGVNDATAEVFTLADAKQLRDYANKTGLGWVAMWSGNRDRACHTLSTHYVSGNCSDVHQKMFAFQRILNGLAEPADVMINASDILVRPMHSRHHKHVKKHMSPKAHDK